MRHRRATPACDGTFCAPLKSRKTSAQIVKTPLFLTLSFAFFSSSWLPSSPLRSLARTAQILTTLQGACKPRAVATPETGYLWLIPAKTSLKLYLQPITCRCTRRRPPRRLRFPSARLFLFFFSLSFFFFHRSLCHQKRFHFDARLGFFFLIFIYFFSLFTFGFFERVSPRLVSSASLRPPAEAANPEECAQLLRHVASTPTLPPQYWLTLHCLLRHFARVCQSGAKNLLSARALGEIFSPVLFRQQTARWVFELRGNVSAPPPTNHQHHHHCCILCQR